MLRNHRKEKVLVAIARYPFVGGGVLILGIPMSLSLDIFRTSIPFQHKHAFFYALKCLETNPFCRMTGRFAFQVADGVRKGLFLTGLVLNLIILVIFALALTAGLNSEDNVRSFHWIKGTATTIPKDSTMEPFKVETYMSVNARVVDFMGVKPNVRDLIYKEFEHPTNAFQTGLSGKTVPTVEVTPKTSSGDKITFSHYTEDFCATGNLEADWSCNHPESYERFLDFFALIVLCVIAQLSAALANCQRWTLFGDVNCQKFWATISAIFVCASAFSIYFVTMQFLTFLPTTLQPIGYTEWGAQIPTTTVVWEMSIYIWLILGAAVLKIFDILINCLIATPPGRHEKPSGDYKHVDMDDYMLRFNDCDRAERAYQGP